MRADIFAALRKACSFSVAWLLFWGLPVHAQQPADTTRQLKKMPDKYVAEMERRQQTLSTSLSQKQKKLATKLQRLDQKAYAQLKRADTAVANNWLAGSAAYLQQRATTSPYIPRLDTLTCLVKYLHTDKAKEALKSMDILKQNWSDAAQLKRYIEEREGMLKQLQSQFSQLTSLNKVLSKYSRETYYYKERLKQWKTALDEPSAWEAAAIKVLNKVPAFQQFLRNNSQLSSMFGMPSNSTTDQLAAAIGAMQTSAMVHQQLEQRIGAAARDAEQRIAETVGGDADIAALKDKVTPSLPRSSDTPDDMPDFKPNSQRTKKLLQRLEYGFNLQTGVRARYQFPASNDLAATLGYRLNDRMVAGVGMAYKFGLGDGWDKITLVSNGIGFRSYFDYKITAKGKGRGIISGLWISGGFEENYWARFKNIEALRRAVWQSSGLIGISKKVQYKNKYTKLQVLWDFLPPIGDRPLIFRWGYAF